MNIMHKTEAEFERGIEPYCEILKQAMSKARIETQQLWDKWREDCLSDPLTPNPWIILMGVQLPK